MCNRRQTTWARHMSSGCRMALVAFAPVAGVGIRFGSASARDLEPRAFSNAPVGLNFMLAGYAHSTGNSSFDDAVTAALQIQEASGRIHQGVFSYVRTVDFFGLSGRLGVIVSLAVGRWEGTVADTIATVSREELADPRVLFSVGFSGAPALQGRRGTQSMGGRSERMRSKRAICD